MTRGRDPSQEIGVSMTREGERIPKEEDILDIQEKDPDTIGMTDHSQGQDMSQEIIEEEVLLNIKIGERIEMRRTNPGREARKCLKSVLLVDVKDA